MNNKILSIGLFALLGLSLISMLPFQNAYAQTSATVTTYGTNNASDDLCPTVTQTGSIIWLGCFSSSASTTLRINTLNGNTTLASVVTLASQSSTAMRFFPVGSDSIVLADLSASPTVIRKYTLSGGTVTNSASLSLTGCTSGSRLSTISTSLVVKCTDNTLRVVNMNTMILTTSTNSLAQGGCATVNGAMLFTTTKGIVWCDNTEIYPFTLSGSTATLGTGVTGLISSVTKNVLVFGNYVWIVDASSSSSSAVQIVNIDTSSMIFSGSVQSLPSGVGSSMAVTGNYLFVQDETNKNILVYDWTLTQPSVAVANISYTSESLNTATHGQISQASDNISFILTSSVIDKGRYWIVSSIVIDGSPIGFTPSPSQTGGVDCSQSENFNIVICRIVGQTGGNIGGLGGILDTGLFNLFTNSGLIDGSDTNPQTNGVGYFILISGFAIMIGIFFVATNGSLNKVPTFIWMISAIALIGAITAIGWIDPTFLVIGIIVIVALAAMQIRNSITTGFDFARGDF